MKCIVCVPVQAAWSVSKAYIDSALSIDDTSKNFQAAFFRWTHFDVTHFLIQNFSFRYLHYISLVYFKIWALFKKKKKKKKKFSLSGQKQFWPQMSK